MRMLCVTMLSYRDEPSFKITSIHYSCSVQPDNVYRICMSCVSTVSFLLSKVNIGAVVFVAVHSDVHSCEYYYK